MLTLEEYDKLPIGTIFRQGVSTNSESGLYMTNTNKDRLLLWIAKKRIEGWCIYCHWADSGLNYVTIAGDKVTSKPNIQNLVPCDDEVLKLYVD